MIPELGQFALSLALLLAVLQGTLPLWGAHRGNVRLMQLAGFTAAGQFVFVALAFACLATSFLESDFSVLNVASNSNTKLPTHYKFTATWGSHEGSLLLWTLMLAGWSLAVTIFSRGLPDRLRARVLGVLGLVSIGFLLFMLTTSNPFDRLFPPAPEGRDLNPLLQDPGMVYHPPMLYMGYVGFSVAFAFAVAALIEGKLDSAWARWSRPWTTAAWCFLTIGIMLGSAWAYYELGWGGWWFWDPVENASFMPWLAGTALIHSLAVTEKRGAFKSWTVLLAIMAFSLSLLGTFLVRSGVLTSVHAFATDPKRGVFILAFLSVVIGGSLLLYAIRAGKVGLGGRFDPVSRESMLLANNVLLTVAMGAVLLGTLYPLFLDVLNLGKISVGPPYFNTVFYPLMAPALFLMAVGPVARWKSAPLPELMTRLRWALACAVVSALILPLIVGRWTPLVALGLFFALWIFFATAAQLYHRFKQVPGTLGAKLRANSLSYYGMTLSHLGIGVFIVGVTMVMGYEVRKDAVMKPGDQLEVSGYTFTFKGTEPLKGPNYEAMRGTIDVTRNGSPVVTLRPEKRFYAIQQQTMTEAAIDSGFTRDLYVSLDEPKENGAWGVAVFIKPFIDWVWFGCVFMALGGLLAIADKRYRVHARKAATVPGAQGAAAD